MAPGWPVSLHRVLLGLSCSASTSRGFRICGPGALRVQAALYCANDVAGPTEEYQGHGLDRTAPCTVLKVAPSRSLPATVTLVSLPLGSGLLNLEATPNMISFRKGLCSSGWGCYYWVFLRFSYSFLHSGCCDLPAVSGWGPEVLSAAGLQTEATKASVRGLLRSACGTFLLKGEHFFWKHLWAISVS